MHSETSVLRLGVIPKSLGSSGWPLGLARGSFAGAQIYQMYFLEVDASLVTIQGSTSTGFYPGSYTCHVRCRSRVSTWCRRSLLAIGFGFNDSVFLFRYFLHVSDSKEPLEGSQVVSRVVVS